MNTNTNGLKIVKEFTIWMEKHAGFSAQLEVGTAFAGYVKFGGQKWTSILDAACEKRGMRWFSLSGRLYAPDGINFFITD